MLGQLGLEPEAHRRAPEQVPAFAQQPPRRPRRVFGERALPDPEVVEPDPVGVQQPRHVVVGGHEQRRRVGERLVVEQQPRIDVTVRRDHRQVTHRVVQPPRDRPLARLRGQQPIRVQVLRRPGRSHMLIVRLGLPVARGHPGGRAPASGCGV